MPIRSALQQRKAREELTLASQHDSLIKGTQRVLAKQRENIVVPEKIGSDLATKFKDHAVRDSTTFNRPLKTRNERSIRLAYAMHLFGDYIVPPFIQKAFLDALDDQSLFKTRDIEIAISLFLAVRGGKSVWKTVTKEYLSKRETHDLLNVKQDFTIREAFVYVMALQDCDRSRAHTIAKSRIMDLYNFSHGAEFWRDVIRFFARNHCDRREMNDILDFLRTRDRTTYSMKGRTVTTLLRAHEEWIRESARVKELGEHTWSGISIRDLKFATRDGKHEWFCFQIKDSKTLGQEGTKQRHCVSSYRPMCSSGSIGIFSLRRRDRTIEGVEQDYDRCLTIEVTREGKIRQVRGYANRMAETFEDEALHYWAAQNGMNYNPGRMY
jgi:hypothetical protein